MPIRNKLVLIPLVLSLLAVACSDEVKKKDSADSTGAPDPNACTSLSSDHKYFCLENALQKSDLATACATDATGVLCGKDKFLNEGYGGLVYPIPVVTFFNDLYASYVSYFYNRNGVLPAYRHFGQYFGLIYDDPFEDPESPPATPADVDANALPIGLVAGGELNDISYASESCALCHFAQSNDGYYRFGVANTMLKYGGLKLAFNQFVCYAEALAPYDNLETQCASTVDIDTLAEPEKSECEAYRAFLRSTGNVTLLQLWNSDEVVSADERSVLLGNLKNEVPGSTTACAAVGQMLKPYSAKQVVELSGWDGVQLPNGAVRHANASRIDRFYHSVSTADGVELDIDDDVHAPVKIPVLGDLVSESAAMAGNYSGQFLASGVVSSLQHYVRLHTALVGGNIADAKVQDAALVPLMTFIAGFKLPKPAVSAETLAAPEYQSGKTLFEQNCSSACHDVTGTSDQDPVAYYSTVGTDNSYAFMLDKDGTHTVTPDLTPADTWNTLQGYLKPPHLQGLWTYQGFLHNGMSYSLENLFCLTGPTRNLRDEKDSAGKPVHAAPFLDGGHPQTCDAALTNQNRLDMITYLRTL